VIFRLDSAKARVHRWHMKLLPLIAMAFLVSRSVAWSEMTDKEIIALMNRVTLSTNGGDINSLNELKAMPPKWAVVSYLTLFKQNYNINGATPQNKAIGAKCAQLLTTTPDGEALLVKLINDIDLKLPNQIYYQQISAINCMRIVNNKFAVRVLGAALNDTEMGGRAANALAMMKLPDAPFTLKQEARPSNAEGVAKWRTWWDANKGNYTE
jgi:hypothetical protein